ncbi:MAG: 3'-5' exonuclease [Solobacterium sp.]|jgi:DNA polymerase-3 subunit epsilon|nr:3'-5' exonuclease [Solobacterium sp.]MCH4048204.1 3'-5' exonuclease [Solobacterium sp.]MCH4074942.1 3'-5' exonuclease [Solobacterium sp.]MCI1314391.1 3'-5' exonuclease [Solobacterium sp.]MCI1346568.1 3'-5' exonuclease [Solobacterium sp.]
MRVTAIDFETANGSPASVCAVGVSVLEDGCVEEKFYSLIRPEENVDYFDWRNIQVHGIHPEDVREAPTFPEIYHELTDLFDNSIVCAHNARFDMTCLKKTCLNTGKPIPVLRYFDTLELSRHAFPALAHHRLDDMCDYLQVELNHHNALSDSYGCAMIAAQVMNLTGIFDIEEMLEACHTHIREL